MVIRLSEYQCNNVECKFPHYGINKGLLLVGFSLAIKTTHEFNGEPLIYFVNAQSLLSIFARKQQHHADAEITRESRCRRHHCSPPRHHLVHATTGGVDEAEEKLSSGAKLKAHE